MANNSSASKIAEILQKHGQDLLNEWVTLQSAHPGGNRRGVDDRLARQESNELLSAVRSAIQTGSTQVETGQEWAGVRELLDRISANRINLGSTPSEVAIFVFSLKQPLFARLREQYRNDAESLALETWFASELIDQIGLYVTEAYQKTRNEIIMRQQEEMLELSTPVVELWEGVLALPLIGTLDSARTQVVMQNLLQAIVDTGSEIAIIDITGVPTVDTLVAQHLLKTVAAARLMGADCIISGIRPQIAQTIIHLGVDLANVVTKATLADAFAVALRRNGLAIVRKDSKLREPEVF